VIALLAATSLALLGPPGRVRPPRDPDLVPVLSDAAGSWRGASLLYCPAEECPTAFAGVEAMPGASCPTCGRALQAMAPSEQRLLPRDTRIVRNRYRDPAGRAVVAAIVLMGADRTSIHDPFTCLRGQGNSIQRVRRLRVPLDAPGRSLDMALLDLVRVVNRPDGPPLRDASFYAYWFRGGGRETSSRYRMLAMMTLDRVLRGRADPWAYVSVAGARDGEFGDAAAELSEFVRQLYPLLTAREGSRPPAPADPQERTAR
jgi:EpsI family protein